MRKASGPGAFIYYASPGEAAFVSRSAVRRKYDFKKHPDSPVPGCLGAGRGLREGASIPQYLTTLTEHTAFSAPHDRVLIHSRTRRSHPRSGSAKPR